MSLRFFDVPLVLFMRLYRKLWLRVCLYALGSLMIAVVGPWGTMVLPASFSMTLSTSAVMPILTILASSMLAVSTFSLNVMVSAHRSAAQNTTPRVHRLLLEDTTTQSVLAVFMGAFVYALTSIVLIQMGFYPPEALLVVMGVTVLIVMLVIGAILRWIEHLSTLGSLDDTLSIVRLRTRARLETFRKQPAYGALPMTGAVVIPQTCTDIVAPKSGYIQLLDVHGLSSGTPKGAITYVLCGPGHHVLEGTLLAQVSGTQSTDILSAIQSHFTIGDQRSFEQDPLFGLQILSEIASRALSPGINDPGTAIQVLNTLTTLLWEASHIVAEPPETCAKNVVLPALSSLDIVETAFCAIARDGADLEEVQTTLQTALISLKTCPDTEMSQAAQTLFERLS
jgi:uncharacterized membrane protein